MNYKKIKSELENLLGASVKIVLYDDKTLKGILQKSTDYTNAYSIENCHFRKSHIKSIEKY